MDHMTADSLLICKLLNCRQLTGSLFALGFTQLGDRFFIFSNYISQPFKIIRGEEYISSDNHLSTYCASSLPIFVVLHKISN